MLVDRGIKQPDKMNRMIFELLHYGKPVQLKRALEQGVDVNGKGLTRF